MASATGATRGTEAAGTLGRNTSATDFTALFEHAQLGIALVSADGLGVRYENEAMRRALASCGVLARKPGAPITDGLHTDVARGLDTVLSEARFIDGACSAVVPIPCTGVGRFDAWLCHAWPMATPRSTLDPERRSAAARDESRLRTRRSDDMLVLAIDASLTAATERAQHRDVTERVLLGALREERRADEAEHAREAATNANAERGRLLAATSHELRTPLQAIGGYAELLAMGAAGEVTDRQRLILANIVRAMHHLLHLSSALLEQGRLEDGRVAYQMSHVNAVALLRDAVTLVRVQAEAKGVNLVLEPCADVVHVYADRGKLGQVVINLLANAIKFTAEGGEIRVSCARVESDQHILPRVEIRVADTGTGIAPDQLDRIFVPYVQLKPSVGGTDEGVGLGLAISRTLARGMGGELEVRSELGVGSTFTLSLPAGLPTLPADDAR